MNHRVINLKVMRIQPSLNRSIAIHNFHNKDVSTKALYSDKGAILGTVCLDCVKLFTPSLKVYELLLRRQIFEQGRYMLDLFADDMY